MAEVSWPVELEYEREGRTYHVTDAASDADLMQEESLLSRKLLPLRREPWTPNLKCRW